MKRKYKKTKAKGYAQIKNGIIAVLAAIVLVIVAMNVEQFKISTGEAATPLDVRVWPSFTLQDTDDLTSEISSDQPPEGGIAPTTPSPTDIPASYSFVGITSTNLSYLYGPVYFTHENQLPKLLNSGNFASATPSGDYVFCIQVITIDVSGKPLITKPVKIDTRSGSYGTITALDVQGNWPTLWNALVPARGGSDYVYTAMNADSTSPNYLTGQVVVARNGVKYATYNTSCLQPTFSSDGSKIAWVTKSGDRKKFGDGDLYMFDVLAKKVDRIYDATSTQECVSPSLPSDPLLLQAFSMISKNSTGVLKQYVYVRFQSEVKQVNMTKIPVGTYYNWNSNVKMSEDGEGIVWEAKKERVHLPGQRGYNILAAPIFPLQATLGYALELAPYDSFQRRRLPDLANGGYIIFSNWVGKAGGDPVEESVKYAIYGARAFAGARIFAIYDAVGMDFAPTFTGQN